VNNYKTSILSICLFIVSVLICVNVNAVAIEIHADEKPHLDALIKRLGIDKDKVEIWARSLDKEKRKYTDYYREFGDYKYFYLHNNKPYQKINFVTNYEDRVVYLRVLQSNVVDLREIQHFKSIQWLDIHVTNIKSLRGISKLKKLERLDFLGNEKISSLSEIKNLPRLKVINSDTNSSITDISGMKNLPAFKEFLCRSCKIESVESLSTFTSLEKLEIGINANSLDPLRSLKNLKFLKTTSLVLKEIDAINDMTSLEKVWFRGGKAEGLDMLKTLPNLKSMRFLDNPLKELPDLSKLPALEVFSIVRSNISKVDLPSELHKLKILKFIGNENLKTIPKISSLPNLEKLTLTKSDFESIEIDYLPSLMVLDLSNTNITQLGDFSKFPNLEELKLFNTKVMSLKPLLDAPKLWSVALDRSARNIPNFGLITQALGENALRHTDIDASRPSAKERYEQLLAEKKSLKPEKTNRRRRN
jgi:hypothetical protein